MSGGLNHVVLMGRLTRDPEVKYTQSGKMITEFSLAINRIYERDSEADFIGCVAWEKTAELVSKYLFKGNQVALEGSLRQDRWTTDDGKSRSKTKVTVSRIHFVTSKGDAQTEGSEPEKRSEDRTEHISNYKNDKYTEDLDESIKGDEKTKQAEKEKDEDQKQLDEGPGFMSEMDDDEIPF